MGLGILREVRFLLFCVGEITPISCLVCTKIDRDPGGTAYKVDELGDLRLHCSHALYSGGAVTDNCNTFVRPVVGVIPMYHSLIIFVCEFMNSI